MMINVAILGHGVVGSGAAEILINKKELLKKSVGDELNLKYILDLREFPDLPYADKFTKDFNVILNDPSIKIVAEMMGGVEPAYSFARACLESGKSVVTSNKELVAAKGAELIAIAEKTNSNFMFEASVGGGIPILRPLMQCLCANDIVKIRGILNGTSNFILTKMIEENVSLPAALEEAQRLGYAERDPSADIDGKDACRKICILATLAYGKHIYPQFVKTEGIRGITLDDVAYAEDFGCVIKLIGRAEKNAEGKVVIGVSPALIKKSNPLACAGGVFNAITVNGDATGDVMFYGAGAGKMPTASAVCADIADCAKHLQKRKSISWQDGGEADVADPNGEVSAYYIMVGAADPAAAESEISELFPQAKFLKRSGQPEKELAFITAADTEKAVREKTEQFKNCLLKTSIRVLD